MATGGGKENTTSPDGEKVHSGVRDPENVVVAIAGQGQAVNAAGYKDQLTRQYGLFGIVGIALTVDNAWAALGSSISVSILNGGPPGLIFGLIVAVFYYSFIGLSLAELASSVPTAGGVYHWATIAAGPRWGRMVGFFTGWLNFYGWMFDLAALVQIAANILVQMYATWHPGYAAEPWHVYVAFLGVLWASTLFIVFANPLVPHAQNAGMFFVVVGGLVTIVVIAAMPSTHASNHFVWGSFQENNLTGWQGGVAFLRHVPILHRVVGVLNGAFTVGTPDAITHIAEELPQPRRDLPRAIGLQIGLGGLYAFVFAIALSYAITDLEILQTVTNTYPLAGIYLQATGSPGGTFGLLFILFLSTICCCVGTVLTNSRTYWALARDNAVPFSSIFGRVNEKLSCPVYATLFVSAVATGLGAIPLGSSSAFLALTGSFIVLTTVSYAIPLTANMLTGRRFFPAGPFHLGKFGWGVNFVAVLFITLFDILFCFLTFILASTVRIAPHVEPLGDSDTIEPRPMLSTEDAARLEPRRLSHRPTTVAQAQYRAYIVAVVPWYAGSQAVLAWELANEPRSVRGCGPGVVEMVGAETSAYDNGLDSDHLARRQGLRLFLTGGGDGDGSYPFLFGAKALTSPPSTSKTRETRERAGRKLFKPSKSQSIMEAIATLSLVCNVFAVVDFGAKVIGVCRSLKTEPAPEPHIAANSKKLAALLSDLQANIDQFSAVFPQSSSISKGAVATNAHQQQARDRLSIIASDLLQDINELQDIFATITKKASNDSKLNRLAVAFRFKFQYEARISKLGRKLEKNQAILDTEFLANICTTTQASAARSEQMYSTLSTTLQSFITRWAEGTRDVSRLIASEGEATRDHITLKSDDIKTHVTSVVHSDAADREAREQRKSILKTLWFPEMNARENIIVDASKETVEWIFDDGPQEPELVRYSRPDCEFRSWLRSDEPMYWVNGKPGSGKSTVMKYLSHEQRTLECLDEKSKSVVIARFFSTELCTNSLQKQVPGLLRTLLHQIFETSPDTLDETIKNSPKITLKRSEHDWSMADLEQILFQVTGTGDKLFCLFIDGLDEIEPTQQHQMSELLRSLSQSVNVKICASSRPELLFKSVQG
ncbi:hypothetical protein SLS62_001332 [Diatrype stigma]|uniref:Nephrocystin 3-like N-terminal domain-containing protein n=1 Tax=Diatrype stigma TaxID=117547 RepID=A0AAN9YRQ1_9PEZI